MQILRQSTQIIVRIGPAVDIADGITPVTTLALSTADEAELLKANTATTTSIAGATMAAITGCDGWYALTLTTSLTDTVGCLDVMINDDSLILPIYARFQVIEEAAYDAMYAASAVGPLLANANGSVLTEAGGTGDHLTALATAAALATVDSEIGAIDTVVDAILVDTGTTLPATLATIDSEVGAIDTVVDAILVDTAVIGAAGAGLTEAGGTGDHLTALATAAALATVDTEVGVIDGVVDAILLDTAEIGAAGAGLTALATAAALATVDSEVGAIDTVVDAILVDTAEIGAAGAGLTEAGGTGDQLTALATVVAIQAALGIHQTTIATLASQVSFTLTAGSADDGAYEGYGALVRDQSTSTQVALGVVATYTGETRTVALEVDPAIYTMAVGDTIILLPAKMTDLVDANMTHTVGQELKGDGTAGDKFRSTLVA